jgi:hypothetical protein
MAKKAKTKAAQAPKKATQSAPQSNGEQGTVASYFKAIFKKNPKLLKTRSNDEILHRWLTDHPGNKEVPERIKGSLSNMKSILRNKRRKKKQAAQGTTTAQVTPLTTDKRLEQLEEAIDDCMTFARQADQDILATVIGLLRRARNQVVWQLGQGTR